MRTPEQIIGEDAVTQLAFEGYAVVVLRTPLDGEQVAVAVDLYRRCDALQQVIDARTSLPAADIRSYLRIMREAYTALYLRLTPSERNDLVAAIGRAKP